MHGIREGGGSIRCRHRFLLLERNKEAVSNEPANKLLCDRHLQGRRSVAFERGAAHVAHLARLPIASGPMHSLAVIPHHEIMLPPGVGVHELSLGRVLDKIAHKGHCFRHGPADDADRNSDLRPVVGLVLTRRWRTGANLTRSSAVNSVKPSWPRENSSECSVIRSSISALISGTSAS